MMAASGARSIRLPPPTVGDAQPRFCGHIRGVLTTPRESWEPRLPMRRPFEIALAAFWRFLADDGWAIASHIALSALMAMFPFFIVLTSLAGILFDSGDLADRVARLLLSTWPAEVA